MGGTISKGVKIIAPIVSRFNPIAGIVLSAATWISDISRNERRRRRTNTEIDEQLRAQEAAALQIEDTRLQDNLIEIRKIYNEHYGYISQDNATMEEYYLTIKIALEQEKIVIENLPEILTILDASARGNNSVVIPGLEKFKQEIMVLLHWGLMHIAILAGNEVAYKHILSLCGSTIDSLELDHLGHSILEYAHLLRDQQLIYDLKRNQELLQQAKAYKAAQLTLASRQIAWNSPDDKYAVLLLEYLEKGDLTIVNALITVGAIPNSAGKFKELIKNLFNLEQHQILKTLLETNSSYVSMELIRELEAIATTPRSYSKQDSIDCLKAFFWLHQHGFSKINQIHPQTNKTALEVAIGTGSYYNFINLLKCGANIEQTNFLGETPLMIAVSSKQPDIVRYLITTHQIDPRVYSNQYTTALAMLPSTQQFNKILLMNRAKQLYLKENEEQQHNKLSSGFFSSFASNDFLTQAGYFCNLWRQGKLSASLARTPIVLGLYVLGIQQVLPWDENELPWLSRKLNLKIRFLPNDITFNSDAATATWINISKTEKGYKAEWSMDLAKHIIETFEPKIQLYNYNFKDLSLNINSREVYNSINNYIYGNYVLLERFFERNQPQKLRLPLKDWQQDVRYFSSRRDELVQSALISAEPQTIETTNQDQFHYYYKMPKPDAGYQAIGISRITAAKLLLDNLDNPQIFNSIKVEWVNWVVTLKVLPPDLLHIDGLIDILHDYNEVIEYLHKDPSNNTALSIINSKNIKLYELATKEQCAIYIVKIIAAPYNYLNPLKYYSMQYNLPVGGTLVALAEIAKFNINVWVGDIEHKQIHCTLNYKALNAIKTINIWQMSPTYNHLSEVAILSKTNDLQIKPIITHTKLFSSIESDTDLGVILHGWFASLTEKIGLTPQNDLLALLLQVKAKIEQREEEQNLLQEIELYRDELSDELSKKFGSEFGNMQALDQYWAPTADQRVRDWAREHLLKEHYDLIENYKNQVEFLQEKLFKELEEKLSRLEQEHNNHLQIFEQSLSKLKEWRATQEGQAILESNRNKDLIINEVRNQLAIAHANVKKQYKKGIRGIISNIVTSVVGRFLPQPTSMHQAMGIGASMSMTSSIIRGDGFKLRNAAASSISYGFNQIKLQEDLVQIAVKGMAENLITGVILEKNGKNILRRTVLGGVQQLCNYGIRNHIKFSDDYVKAVFKGSVDGVLEAVKLGEKHLDEILVLASQSIANNIKEVQETLLLEQRFAKLNIKSQIEQKDKEVAAEQEELEQDELLNAIFLQEDQAELIDKFKAKISNFDQHHTTTSDNYLDVQEIARYINSLDGDQVKALAKALESFELSERQINEVKNQPIIMEATCGSPVDSASSGKQALQDTSLSWWERFQKNYIKVTLEMDNFESTLYKEQSKAISEAGATIAVGSGRSTIAAAQKVKILALWLSEEAGIIEKGVTEDYIKKTTEEKKLYESTIIRQSELAKIAESGTDLFFSYVTGRAGLQAVKTVGGIIYREYTKGKIFKEAAEGGKYAGELKRYRQDMGIKELHKTISSHKKTISKHKEYIKNPRLKYQDEWDGMSEDLKEKAIRHWEEDIKRAKIYEEFAKRALKEKLSNTGPNELPKP